MFLEERRNYSKAAYPLPIALFLLESNQPKSQSYLSEYSKTLEYWWRGARKGSSHLLTVRRWRLVVSSRDLMRNEGLGHSLMKMTENANLMYTGVQPTFGVKVEVFEFTCCLSQPGTDCSTEALGMTLCTFYLPSRTLPASSLTWGIPEIQVMLLGKTLNVFWTLKKRID